MLRMGLDTSCSLGSVQGKFQHDLRTGGKWPWGGLVLLLPVLKEVPVRLSGPGLDSYQQCSISILS